MVTEYTLIGITKTFDSVKALKGINLDIGDELLGIIGHSGVGKTTLLKILAGLETPTSGTIRYNGTKIDSSNFQLLRKQATMIFQSPLFLRGDVYTNIAYGLRLRKTPEPMIIEHVENALEAVRLSGFGTRVAKKLSGGEQQRVALARALVLDPKVLLLDEPTSNLDPANTSIISDILREQSKNRVIVIATHDLLQVSRLAARVLFLKDGVISEESAPERMEAITRFTSNLFTGISEHREGVSTINVESIRLRFTEPTEGRVTIHIRPQDIILSKDWIETSARNQFRGPIVGVEEKNGVVMVSIDVGIVFRAQITRKSFDEMGLSLGRVVNISFKASSVILL
jgi:tungstate transport system ATP-binding protein